MHNSDDRKNWSFPDVSYVIEDEFGNYVMNAQVTVHQERINELNQLLAENHQLV